MTKDEIGALFDSLLKADISDETREEIGTFARAFGEGHLDEDDLAYVTALAKRLGVGSGGAKRASAPIEADPPTDETPDVAALLAERDALKRRIEMLETELASARSEGDVKFRRAREALARLYDPVMERGDGADRVVKAEELKELWAELEEIDKGG